MSKPDSRLVTLSKLMSLILRHDPSGFGVTLDAEGYTSLGELLEAIHRGLPHATRNDVIAVVQTIEPEKQRFSILDDDIRADYGHSLKGRIEHQAAVPPSLLYHGTHKDAMAAILAHGLSPMKRQYVHLTSDREIAMKVGSRRGKPSLIQVDAARAHSDGVRFYRANVSFWLADVLTPKYLKCAE